MTLGFTQKINGKPNYFVEKIWSGLINTKSVNKLYLSDYEKYLKLHQDKFGFDFGYNQIFIQPKLHTIREDPHDRWKAGNDIHFVINNRTKNRFQFAPSIKCVSVQEIIISHTKTLHFVHIDGYCLTESEVIELAQNDGFDSLEDFFDYFNKDFKGKIIHWTDLKY